LPDTRFEAFDLVKRLEELGVAFHAVSPVCIFAIAAIPSIGFPARSHAFVALRNASKGVVASAHQLPVALTWARHTVFDRRITHGQQP